jgi:NAD(P)-dependent dehydrogenase (short-subunit alcohol dehydrogenase family)
MKIAIVTGASRGLGRAIAIGLAADGFALALAARDTAGLNETAEACRKAGAPDALVLASDLSKADAPQQVVDAVQAHFGRIDLLVNNAGATKRADFLSLADEDFLDGFQLKFHATVRFCRAAWAALAASQGSIINISGIGAHTPEPDFTVGGSVNSALLNFTKAIAKRASADDCHGSGHQR